MITAPISALEQAEIDRVCVIRDNYQTATEFEQTKYSLHNLGGMLDMLDGLNHKNQIEAVLRKVKRLQTAKMNLQTRSCSRVNCTFVEIHALDLPTFIAKFAQ